MFTEMFNMIFLFFLFKHIFYGGLTLLNRSRLTPQLPSLFKRTQYRHSYDKAITYAKIQSDLSLLQRGITIVGFSAIWLLGGFGVVERLLLQLPLHEFLQGILFIFCIQVIDYMLCAGFDIINTFHVSPRFGLGRPTYLRYLLDLCIGSLLKGVETVAYTGVVFGCFFYFNFWGVIICASVLLGIDYFIESFLSISICKLFNKFIPLPSGRLKQAITTYAAKINFPLDKILVMNASIRSNETNAFFTGVGRGKSIVLYDTLIKAHNIPEIVGILGHEVGHYRYRHINKQLLLTFFNRIVELSILWYFVFNTEFIQVFGMQQLSFFAGIAFLEILQAPWSILFNTISNIISRHWETQADTFELTTVNNPGASIRSFQKLAICNLATLTPHPLYVFFCFSHPPLISRIEAAQQYKRYKIQRK